MSRSSGLRDKIEQLYSAEQIAARVEQLAGEIARGEPGDLVIVSILRGGFVFAADLIRALHREGVGAELDFLVLASYGGRQSSSGQIDMVRDVETDIGGRPVLVVDDLLDSGRTLDFARQLLAARGAQRVATCVLLDKAAQRTVEISPDYKGFDCPAHFVVGYGMGEGNLYRTLPFVGRIMDD